MATKSDVKKQLEGILGQKLGDDAVELIRLIQSFAVSTNTPCDISQRNIIQVGPNTCYESRVLDVSSFAATESNGQSVFRLSRFICPKGEVFSGPVNVVATPFSSKPHFLTVNHSLVNNGADFEIRVFAWDANGAPAPNVFFHWRCRIELPNILQ